MADSHDTLSLPENRPDLESLIEAAIARLDALDGDSDLEDGGDAEPDDHEASSEPSVVYDYECGPILVSRARP